MTFWDTFAEVYHEIWRFVDTPMNFGGVSFSFGDVLLVSGLMSLVVKCVYDIIYDER